MVHIQTFAKINKVTVFFLTQSNLHRWLTNGSFVVTERSGAFLPAAVPGAQCVTINEGLDVDGALYNRYLPF